MCSLEYVSSSDRWISIGTSFIALFPSLSSSDRSWPSHSHHRCFYCAHIFFLLWHFCFGMRYCELAMLSVDVRSPLSFLLCTFLLSCPRSPRLRLVGIFIVAVNISDVQLCAMYKCTIALVFIMNFKCVAPAECVQCAHQKFDHSVQNEIFHRANCIL